MSLVMPKPNDAEFELPPAETHLAVCYRVIDLGTQEVKWQDKIKKQHKILLSWEFPEARMSDGRPFSIHQRYTLSASDKATLRKHLESWRGKPFTEEEFGVFDLGKLLGAGCLINVIHQTSGDKTYANIGGILKLLKGTKVPKPENETIYFSLGNFDQAVFDKLPDGIKQIIQKSPEYAMAINPLPDHDDDYGASRIVMRDPSHPGDALDVPF